MLIYFFINLEILNGCISFIIGRADTRLKNFVKLGELFLSIEVLFDNSFNIRALTKSLWVCGRSIKTFQ